MTIARPHPTGVERYFRPDEIIVSKTDLKGIITYANRVFIDIAGYREEELLGQPHNLIRHPDMPRCVFKLLWDRISAGKEIFAYVKNMCKSGDHYWVHAHVTPSFDAYGNIVGYHSNRRVPGRSAVAQMESVYARLLEVENSASSWREGMAMATQALVETLKNTGMEYDEFIFSLEA